MGMIELSERNLDKAENYFKHVLDISTRLGKKSQKIATVESMSQLASIYKFKGDFDKQFEFLLMASDFSIKNNLQKYLLTVYQELISYSSNRNDQASVQKYVNSYKTINDSLNQRQLNDRYNLTKSIVQVHVLAKSKTELEKINFIQSQKIKNRNAILITVTISTIILIWLFLRLFSVNKKMKIQHLTIASQKKELETINNTKDKFFSIVAHDLKSPLNSLKSFTNLIIDHFDHLSKDEILTMGNQLRNTVDNTIKMADNLITWARIQMNDHDFSMEKFRVNDIVLNISEVYKEVALNKGISLRCSVEESLTISGDRNQIEFIIRNLVSNAIKFTNKDGSVSLTAKSLPSGVVHISVSDSGVGISDELKDKLFSIGKKQSTSGTAGEQGTGLGLMLSYEFIQLNGGHIDFESSVGIGTTFHIKLNGNG